MVPRVGRVELAETALETLLRQGKRATSSKDSGGKGGGGGGFTAHAMRNLERNLTTVRERKQMPLEHQLVMLSAQTAQPRASPPLVAVSAPFVANRREPSRIPVG